MATEGDQLIARLRADDPRAEAEIAALLYRLVPRWIAWDFSSLSHTEVQDLTDLCVIHVVAVLPRFLGRSSLEHWARMVTRNRVRDWFRKESFWRDKVSSIDQEVSSDGNDGRTLGDFVADPRADASDQVHGRLLLERALQVIRAMSNDRDRRLLWGHYVEGLSVTELLRREGLPASQRVVLDVALCRAKARLLLALKEIAS